MVLEPVGVRPTKRCLGDLGVELPDLGVRLEEIDQPVIVSAQAVPEQRDAGGAERVVALTDRVWFKVKTSDHRAAMTELRGTDLPDWVRPSRLVDRRRRAAPSGQRPARLLRHAAARMHDREDRLFGSPAPGRLGLEAPRCRTSRRVAARDEEHGHPARRDVAEVPAASPSPSSGTIGSRRSSGQRTGTRPTSRSLPRECPTRRCSRCSSTASLELPLKTGSPNRRPWPR